RVHRGGAQRLPCRLPRDEGGIQDGEERKAAADRRLLRTWETRVQVADTAPALVGQGTNRSIGDPTSPFRSIIISQPSTNLDLKKW
ncbi:unnamed protein product, partial [Musa hybrid cultivar]